MDAVAKRAQALLIARRNARAEDSGRVELEQQVQAILEDTSRPVEDRLSDVMDLIENGREEYTLTDLRARMAKWSAN